MASTDPISDMLTRIRNAASVGKNEVSLPHSQVKEAIALTLKDAGFIKDVKNDELNGHKNLQVVINAADESSKITELKRLSTPGRRLYVKAEEIPVVKRGRGIVVVSTSQGMMSGAQAKAKRLGGELICQVY